MNYGDRLRDTVIPEMQGMRKDAACRQFPGRRVSSRVIVDFKGKSAVTSPPKNPIFPEGFDARIVTARLESLIVVRRAGSPGYSY